ncbi:unnamed protein product [Hydatigera taeniaeformis]|uniref:Uncharacterized protein n=1 Tax=Hydatigena taeniaeformis TaxID=6205 RepID=A0A0R3XB90_HYDTA|nr:unnamed protein product [Hydatigera taeniaeformis]
MPKLKLCVTPPCEAPLVVSQVVAVYYTLTTESAGRSFILLGIMNINFREELAAKLNAGPIFPFGGGAHRFGAQPTVTTEHTSIASGDTTPGSLSPGSPSTVGSVVRDFTILSPI